MAIYVKMLRLFSEFEPGVRAESETEMVATTKHTLIWSEPSARVIHICAVIIFPFILLIQFVVRPNKNHIPLMLFHLINRNY